MPETAKQKTVPGQIESQMPPEPIVSDEIVRKVLGPGRGELKDVRVDSLKVSPFRGEEVDAELAKGSFKTKFTATGPILCYTHEGQIYILDGLNRVRHAKASGIEKISALVLDDIEEVDALKLLLVSEFAQGVRSPFATRNQIRQFMKLKPELTKGAHVARILGFSKMHISRVLRLDRLHEEVFQMGLKGNLKASHAYLLAKVKDKKKQLDFAKQLTAAVKHKPIVEKIQTLLGGKKSIESHLSGVRKYCEKLKPAKKAEAIAALRNLITELEPKSEQKV